MKNMVTCHPGALPSRSLTIPTLCHTLPCLALPCLPGHLPSRHPAIPALYHAGPLTSRPLTIPAPCHFGHPGHLPPRSLATPVTCHPGHLPPRSLATPVTCHSGPLPLRPLATPAPCLSGPLPFRPLAIPAPCHPDPLPSRPHDGKWYGWQGRKGPRWQVATCYPHFYCTYVFTSVCLKRIELSTTVFPNASSSRGRIPYCPFIAPLPLFFTIFLESKTSFYC